MRRLAALGAITAIGLILLLTFHTRAPDRPALRSPVPTISRPASVSSATAASGTSTPALRDGSLRVVGRRVHTTWGYVQVAVRTAHRRIVDITAIELPHGNPTDIQISGDAVPQLRAAALAAQSAHIDVISGATVTSEGYLRSLQSALDRLTG
jgi:uncharacterized protein with FMN-binding domain